MPDTRRVRPVSGSGPCKDRTGCTISTTRPIRPTPRRQHRYEDMSADRPVGDRDRVVAPDGRALAVWKRQPGVGAQRDRGRATVTDRTPTFNVSVSEPVGPTASAALAATATNAAATTHDAITGRFIRLRGGRPRDRAAERRRSTAAPVGPLIVSVPTRRRRVTTVALPASAPAEHAPTLPERRARYHLV